MALQRKALMAAVAKAVHPARWICLLILFLVLIGVTALHAEEPLLSAEEQARLAQQFAPVLVFHKAEKFFPVSPLFSFDTKVPISDKEATLRRLGTTESRTAAYLEMNLSERAKLATVHYRAYPAKRNGGNVVVLEYWFYYVRDEYRVRGNILPIWAGGDHPNDLEHLHLILRQVEPGKFVVDEVLASAHEGKIPANRYKYGKAGHDGPTHIFVELGSHALAPDINEDGIFTTGTDGESGSKLQWGIRDRGYSWPRYRSSYMTPRSDGNAVVFQGENAANSTVTTEGAAAQAYTYRLASVDSLGESFAQLDLTGKELKKTFETHTFWFPRVFGRDNGRSKALLVPAPPKSGGDSVGILGVSSSERFFILGTALNLDEPGFLVGGRYSFLTRPLIVPDFILEADGIVTSHKNYLSPQFLLSYPFDGFTRIMFGKSLVTDSWSFSPHQWDTVGTIEVRLGDMRISASARSLGPVRAVSKEFRFYYAFR
jgi:hypothetical protein